MKLKIFQVDAFADKVFAGNPAGVCPLEAWLDDGLLQRIAAENNQAETAFFVPAGDGYEIRWFTPVIEVALCGHATLASAHVLFDRLGCTSAAIRFQTRRSGVLTVSRGEGMLVMDFPTRPPAPAPAPRELLAALGATPESSFLSEEDWLLVYPTPEAVRAITPDMARLARHSNRGVIVTAPGTDCDFVSRFFAPRAGIPEDPVTGSAHCVLIPYWAGRLGKTELHARQVSLRGGELFCRHRGQRVDIGGRAIVYLEGTIEI